MKKIFVLIIITLLATACHKDKVKKEEPTNTGINGLYVLNEGVWNGNNSSLTYYNLDNGNVTSDIFSAINNRGLGDTGNDLQKYGSKLYCVVNTSEIIQVMNLTDAKAITSISLSGKSPRRICFDAGKAYVSCFDGTVVRIDTSSLSIDGTVAVGPNPEGICVCNGKLYVANTGGYNAPNYGSTVSVIDLASLTVIKEITVVCNPYILLVDQQQEILLISNGNYADIHSCLQKISPVTDEVIKTYDFEISNMDIYGNTLLFYNYDYSTMQASFKTFDLVSESIISDHFITDGTTLTTPYLLNIDPQNGDIYISDAYDYTTNGDVFCFSKEGKLKFSFEAGLNPACVVFVRSEE